MEGVVKLFIKQQGWGIIDAGSTVGDVLVLEIAVAPKEQPLIAGTRVEFEAEVDPTSPTGKRATRVTLLPT